MDIPNEYIHTIFDALTKAKPEIKNAMVMASEMNDRKVFDKLESKLNKINDCLVYIEMGAL